MLLKYLTGGKSGSGLNSLIRGKGGSTEESSLLSERFSLSFFYLSKVKPHSCAPNTYTVSMLRREGAVGQREWIGAGWGSLLRKGTQKALC